MANETVTVTKPWQVITNSLPYVGGLLTSGVQYLLDRKAAKEERKYAKDAWDTQIRYNSPAQVMKRYQAAGMNPGWGSASYNATAPQFQTGITSTARAQVPDYLSTISQYQNLKNNSIKAKSMFQDVFEQQLKNYIAEKTLDTKIDMTNTQYDLMKTKLQNDQNFGYLHSLLWDQEYQQKEKMNPLLIGIQQLMLDMKRVGIRDSDSPFIRVMQRYLQGEKGAKSILPYVLGERLASFGGDLLKIGIPSGILGKALKPTSGKINFTKPSYTQPKPSSYIPPQFGY